MENLNYILYEDKQNPNTYLLAFNRFSNPGFIDDGSGWTEEELEEFEFDVINELEEFIETWETEEFTYFVHKLDGLREKLKEMGLSEQKQAWEN